MKPVTAVELLSKYVKGETLLRHCKTVGVAMRYFAEKFGEDADYWQSVGILHDIDFEQHPDNHCVACVDIFNEEKANFPEIEDQIVHAVQSHGFGLCCDVEPAHQMEKVLFAVDELTGLIFACAIYMIENALKKIVKTWNNLLAFTNEENPKKSCMYSLFS